MPSFCAVVDCGSNAARDQGIRFFRIPSMYGPNRKVSELSQRRRQLWINAIKREDFTETKIKYARVCSKHFISGKPASFKDDRNPDWIPSQNMGYTSVASSLQSRGMERFRRGKRRAERMLVSSTMEESADQAMDAEELQEDSVENLQFALQNANKEIYGLREEISKFKLNEDYLKSNKKFVLYYTGFPEYIYVHNIFQIVEPYLLDHSALSKFQQLLMTLMKLRLDLQFTDLANRFLCHRTTAARIFENTIHVLYCRLKNLVYWPEREDLQLNMPNCFKTIFGKKTTVIIDCFELFIEKPSNLDASARTWSNYKHHHTVKFLIGISPQGLIMFISNAYGGRATDKFIAENCNVLDNLLPGDLVLADRGFSIDDSVKIYCAEVKYPTFKRGKKQLGATDLETTRKLASIRIHVERVIGLLRRKYKILHGTFPLITLKKTDNHFALIDKIVVVCSALINLCPGIVPIE